MKKWGWIRSSVLLLTVLGGGGGLATWKYTALQEEAAASANPPEPVETITTAVAQERVHRRSTTAIGTVLAIRSITLRNELPGTVHQVDLTPGRIVEEGTVLVALDVSVEEAELAAQQAKAVLAEKEFARVLGLMESQAASDIEVDRVRADHDTAQAEVERIKAVIAKKTIRAPFRARIGLADVHVGQYLDEGTVLTTLQGVDDSVHVDFAVPQQVAAGLSGGDTVEVLTPPGETSVQADIVAVDARVDPATRSAMIRARMEMAEASAAPGASVRVKVPVGPPQSVVAVPVSALRKGPSGDHVFVILPDEDGKRRAHLRPVESGAMAGDEILIYEGLVAGETVAASGSFKLREAVLVAIDNQEPAELAGF